MAGELIGYGQYDRLAELTCPACEWSGPGAEHEEYFREVFVILRRRYGRRLARVTPTPAAEVYLYGDRPSAPQVIDGLNASLRDSD